MSYDALKTQIEREYTPERELKAGERGKVSLLREKKTGKRIVCHQFCGSAEAYEKLQNVRAPNLPRVEAVAQQDGQVLVLEEYIQGDTLAFLLEGRPLHEEQAKEILIQICRALKVLHELGLVHRDVKPENVVLRGDDVVLIDFDASRENKPEQDTDTRVMGTTGYAAPEQFGFSQTDARADIFSLGVLLNEMLTHRHPARELAQGALRPVVEKCIEVNVDKRYSSVDELLNALNDPAPKRKTGRTRWWILPAAAALLAAMVLVPQLGQRNEAEGSAAEQAIAGQAMERRSQSLRQSKVCWYGDPDIYATQFQYDLDGDGEPEEYLFAGMYNFVDEPRLLQHSAAAINDRPEVLEVVPAVWVQTGEETYAPVEEFAPLLSDCAVTLNRIEGEYEGLAEEIGSLYGIWPGAIRGTFDHVGLWYYEFSAVLAGETLTAVGATRTDLLSQAALSAQPYMTLFRYDLDGDGEEEEYWFGAVSSIREEAFPLIRDGTSFLVGSGSKRVVAPAVWRQTARDAYEPVPQFALLLENARVELRCVEGEVQPAVTTADDLFGVWTGASQVIFTHSGTWVYECAATLNGMELSAAAVTDCEVRME